MRKQVMRNQHSFFTLPQVGKKFIFAIFSVLVLVIGFQVVIQQSAYFQAFAQCLDSTNPRADYLITSEQVGDANRFGSRIGTCIIDPKAVIGDFRQSSYQQLYEEFFERSKLPANQRITLSTAPNTPFTMTAATPLANNTIYRSNENFVISAHPNSSFPTSVVFVEKDLIINSNFTYGDNSHGIVFVVKGSVYFNPSVTRFDGVIIAQGGSNSYSICTATNDPTFSSCPTSAVVVPSGGSLIINGSLIALDKPIYFTRRLRINTFNAAEQVNHQVKYLAILHNLLARTTNIVSENTTYAACTADPTDPLQNNPYLKKPVGCSCVSSDQCASNRCDAVSGTTNFKTCQPSDTAAAQGTIPLPTPQPSTPAPTPTSSPVPPRLVAHWTMDEPSGSIVRDQVGGNTGSTPGSGIAVGRFGLARDLYNGSFITVNNSPAFQSQYMSVSAWVWPKDVTSFPYASIFNRRNAQNQYNFIMELDGTGGIQCMINGSTINSGSTKLTLRQWNHVVCTYDGTNHRIYISKPPAATISQVGAGTYSGVLTNPANATVQIGRNLINGHTFLGYIDDLRVYSYGLSSTEVSALYNQPASPSSLPPAGWENPLKIFTEKLLPTFIGI